jgi:hypothetical protein
MVQLNSPISDPLTFRPAIRGSSINFQAQARGLSFPAIPEPEALASNLLEAILPPTVFCGKTRYRSRDSMVKILKERDFRGTEFIVREGLVVGPFSALEYLEQSEYWANLELWRQLLTQPSDLLREDYSFLKFKGYLGFSTPVSIADEIWNLPSKRAQSDPSQTEFEYW